MMVQKGRETRSANGLCVPVFGATAPTLSPNVVVIATRDHIGPAWRGRSGTLRRTRGGDMLPSEEMDTAVCALCREEFQPELERGFTYGPDGEVLCFECAMARGGVYDETHDRWLEPPNVSDLPLVNSS